jgi:hypothetical protein
VKSSQTTKPSLFSIDLRSLAATRIAAGVYLFCDVIQRMGDASAHYSDAGIFPLEALREWWDGKLWWMLTLHSLDSGAGWPLFVFGVQLVFALLMIIGFQSRFAVTMSWLLLISVQNRNPLVLHGGDQMLRATMFWLLFLPVGAKWSLDGSIAIRRAYGQPVNESMTSIATAGLLLQTTIVYLSTAFLKNSKEWWSEGSAMYYALNIEQFRRYVKEGCTPLQIATPPIRLYMPSINTQASTRDIKSYVSLSTETVDKASQQLRLKRSKPVHSSVHTLDKCMAVCRN